MTNSKDNAFFNWRTCVSVQFLQKKVHYISAISDWYHIRFFYASNTKGEKHGFGMISWSLSKTTHLSIGGQEDWFEYGCRNYNICWIWGQEYWFHFFVGFTGDVFSWQLKLRTILLFFRNDQFWHDYDILCFQRDYDIFMLPERCILMYILMLINRKLLQLFYASHKNWFFIMLILSLWSIMLILILCPLLFIFTIRISELLKIMIHNPQETSGDIFWKSCWKGGCRCSYTSGTDPERN